MKVLQKLYLGFGTIVLVLLVLVVVSFISFAKMSQANSDRARSYGILAETQNMREGLVNMDIAARGFVITGQKDFFIDLLKGQKEYLASSELVKNRTADDAAQQDRLFRLRQNYDEWVQSYFEPLKASWLASKDHRIQVEDVLRISKQGKPYTDAMFNEVTDINAASIRRLDQSSKMAELLKVLTQIVLLVGGGFAVLLAIGLSMLLTGKMQQLSAANADLGKEINERKQIEAELQNSKQAAESASKSKSEFLANMSHELRTPLNAIIGFSEILGDRTFGELNDRQEKYVTNVLNSGRHLLKLINDILDLSKIEAGRMELDPSSFNLAIAVDDVVTIVKTLAARKNIALKLDVDKTLAQFTADESKFKQIMYNLLSNAIKFTPDGGDIGVVVRSCTLQGGEAGVRIAVTDSGIGINPDDQARVFGEFEQVDSSYGRQQQGTGLGLSLTRRFVEMHGGRIWVESLGDGHGSTFLFELPIVSLVKSVGPAVAAAGGVASDAPRDSRPLVLIVEDEDQSRELLTHYLTEAGYLVAQAEDGVQAVQMACELKLHAIVLDIMLPKRNGWDVLTELKSRPETQSIPVVIASVTENRELGFSLGAIDYLVKPVNRERLVEVVRNARAQANKPEVSVLVVDDDPMNVESLKLILETMHCKVLPAYGGQEGWEMAERDVPDLIVLDLMMPEVTGFDVVRRLRGSDRTRDIPVLIYTAKDITEEDRRELNNHVRAIVPKSGSEDLLSELAKLNLME